MTISRTLSTNCHNFFKLSAWDSLWRFASLDLSYGPLPLTDTKRKKLTYIRNTHSPAHPDHSPGWACVAYIGEMCVFVSGRNRERAWREQRSEAQKLFYTCCVQKWSNKMEVDKLVPKRNSTGSVIWQWFVYIARKMLNKPWQNIKQNHCHQR